MLQIGDRRMRIANLASLSNLFTPSMSARFWGFEERAVIDRLYRNHNGVALTTPSATGQEPLAFVRFWTAFFVNGQTLPSFLS
jgi:hypothetical protein